jgi:cbb3-type cytochrome oxidase cytochrome c subunit
VTLLVIFLLVVSVGLVAAVVWLFVDAEDRARELDDLEEDFAELQHEAIVRGWEL